MKIFKNEHMKAFLILVMVVGASWMLNQLQIPKETEQIPSDSGSIGAMISPIEGRYEPVFNIDPGARLGDIDAYERMIEHICFYEGFQPEPYLCPAGHLTIGYGFTEQKYLAMSPMSRETALKILKNEVIPNLEKVIKTYVKVPLSPKQKAALICFTMNCGEGALAKLVSAEHGRLNAGNYKVVPEVLLMYSKASVKGKMVTLGGLVSRRKDEGRMFVGN
jgi:lysozyme